MGDLISRAAAIQAAFKGADEWDGGFNPKYLNELPAVDAAPVVYSEWSWADGGKCKNCGFHNSNFDYNYCPMCGAKMWR